MRRSLKVPNQHASFWELFRSYRATSVKFPSARLPSADLCFRWHDDIKNAGTALALGCFCLVSKGEIDGTRGSIF
jgi:hypothetical protein